MGLQARMTQDDTRLYTPDRDIAHNFDWIVQELAATLERGSWDYLKELAKRENVTDEDLGLVCQALCRYMAIQKDMPKGESMAMTLSRSGFLDLKPAARAVVMAYLGTLYMGVHWAGIREATQGGIGPALTYGRLRWWGYWNVKLMRLPKWRRRLYTFWLRVRRAWREFTRKKVYDA